MGIDPSPVCVENVRRFGIAARIGSLSASLNLGIFDCILMSHVLEHVNNLVDVMTAIHQSILDSPGKQHKTLLYIEVPNASLYQNYILLPYRILIQNISIIFPKIAKSKTLLYKFGHKIKQILSVSDRLIVWGTGQLTMKLLADTSLAKANIVAFVDNNSINQGRMLNGISIVSPEKIVNLQFPILVATLFHQKAIAEQIKSLSISNLVFFLDKHDE